MHKTTRIRYPKYIILSLLLFWGKNSHAGGFSSFEELTPYQNTLYYDGTGNSINFHFGPHNAHLPDSLQTEAERIMFNDFYFFHDCLIALSKTTYYVIDEQHPSIITFQNKREFDAYLQKKDLVPSVWIRWYNKNYDEANLKNLPLAMVVLFPITLLMIGLYFYCLFTIRRSEKIAIRNSKKYFLMALPTIGIMLYLLQHCPQSI